MTWLQGQRGIKGKIRNVLEGETPAYDAAASLNTTGGWRGEAGGGGMPDKAKRSQTVLVRLWKGDTYRDGRITLPALAKVLIRANKMY